MTYAILGWGSVLWDKKEKFEDFWEAIESNCAQEWELAEGLWLPLEFSRISVSSRGGALTLVIDEKNGKDCQVSYAETKRTQITLNHVIEILQRREGAPNKRNIGYWERGCGERHPKKCKSTERIVAWAEQSSFDGVVWIALKSNYCTCVAPQFKPFQPLENPLKYLENPENQEGGLQNSVRKEAVKYICRAPRATQTRLRERLMVEDWFIKEAEILGLDLTPKDY